jgi:hypothetical protein
MTVLVVPRRLKFAIAALLLSIPLIALEVLISTKSPIWNLPYRAIAYWSFASALICIPLCVWLAAARKWALPTIYFFSAIWILSSAWISIQIKHPPLLFFTIFLLAYSTVLISWLQFELHQSFFDPKIAWYHGQPKPIPELRCQLTSGEKSMNFKVSRIDRNGVFLFANLPTQDQELDETNGSSSSFSFLQERRQLELRLNFRENQVVCEGTPILSVHQGVGVQFWNLAPDLKKEMIDFIEKLKGQGYV